MYLLTLLSIAQKATELMQKDPHGLVVSMVAILVVFLSLYILYYCYRFVGYWFTRKKGTKSAKKLSKSEEDEVAAAISLALSLENNMETQAAIAMALDCYLSESVHDKESYIITIKRKK
ncbi:MAG: OadG family protein [Bacteroidales bacterium]|nr:OadG family protein [Bacteroidales bacterium]